MDVLAQTFLFHVHACLDRPDDLAARKGPDDIAVMQVKLGSRGVLVSVHSHQLPVIILDPVILFKRFYDWYHLQPFLHGMDMYYRSIFLYVGAGPLGLPGIYPSQDHPLLIGFR